jgi:hypothetical protein
MNCLKIHQTSKLFYLINKFYIWNEVKDEDEIADDDDED